MLIFPFGPRHDRRSAATPQRGRGPHAAHARATLRVWERRYGLTQPLLSASGQRLYSEDDVRRLPFLKQLTELGHAIGSLAGLDMAQRATGGQHACQRAGGPGWRGQPSARAALARGGHRHGLGSRRLQRPGLRRQLSRPVQVLPGPLPTRPLLRQRCRGRRSMRCWCSRPRLHEGWLASLQVAAPALAALPKAVLYRYAAEATCTALAANGTALLREPQNDTAIGQWLQGVLPANAPVGEAIDAVMRPDSALTPRRWDDAALADFAGLSSTIACECPRHVAELLMQLSHFEAYSAECQHRNVADAELHAYLQQVAGTARARFEAALEHVALHEGLILPPALTAKT